jgi:hypothetical protein
MVFLSGWRVLRSLPGSREETRAGNQAVPLFSGSVPPGSPGFILSGHPGFRQTADAENRSTRRSRTWDSGQPVVLAYSSHPAPLEPPISIPGLSGELRLQFPIYLVPLGPIPRNGLLTLSLPLPPQLPRQTYPTQALIGLHISNLDLVEVE